MVPSGRNAGYVIASDGKRFLVMRWDEQQVAAPEIEYVVNWFDDLKPSSGRPK